jgi:hypothetical protein
VTDLLASVRRVERAHWALGEARLAIALWARGVRYLCGQGPPGDAWGPTVAAFRGAEQPVEVPGEWERVDG